MSNMIGSSHTVNVTSNSIPDPSEVPQLEFVYVVGHGALSEPFTYTVDLRPVSLAVDQSTFEPNLDAAIGHEMALSAEPDGMGTGLFSGVGAGAREVTGLITAVELIGGVGDNQRYRYTLCPWLWSAMRTSNCKAFQNRTVIDVLDEVFANYNFSVDRRLDTSTYPKLTWEMQHGETDAHFIQRLTEQWGISYFFEHDDGYHRLVLAFGSDTWHKFPSAAYHTLPIYPQGSKIDQRHLARSKPINRLYTDKVAFKDYNPRQSKADLITDDSLPRDTLLFEFERYEYEPGLHASRGTGGLHARIHMETHRTKGRRMRGVGNLRNVTAGNTYHIVNHGHDALSREVPIVSIKLLPEDVSIYSDDTQQYTCCVSFEAQSTDEVLRPTLTVHRCRIQDIQCAIATGLENQEIWANNYGCVKIQSGWDRYGQCDESSLPWVRMFNDWSGDQSGTVHVPRIGQEVLVDYLNGDPDTLIIAGRVPNQLNIPPWSLPIQHALSGVANKELFGRRRSHLLTDNTQGQTQAQLSSDHLTSQLNLGYLTSVPGNPDRKDARGEGFDLCTGGQGNL